MSLFNNENVCFKGIYRPYQQHVLNNLNQYSLNDKIHIVAPPGSGKTTLGLEIIKRLNKKALILTPSITIREQWILRFRQDFLKDGLDYHNWISNDIKIDAPIICITYQAFYSAYLNYKNLINIDDEGIEEETDDFSAFNLLDKINEYKIESICLDECHHLKSEWWKSLEEIFSQLNNIKIISLTATPPYDSSNSKWQKYMNLCGPIDDEIFTPELIKEKNLSPHQDFIYFNYPTDDENKILERFYNNAKKIFDKYQYNNQLVEIIKTNHFYQKFKVFKNNYYANPTYYRALSIYLNHNNVKLPLTLKKFVNVEPLKYGHLEILLQNILFNDSSSYPNCEFLCHLKKELIANGLISKRKVNLISNEKIDKILQQSKNKLKSIATIVANEYDNLNSNLRLLILTDYIKKEQKNSINNTDKEIKSLGTIPIFEYLRRENINGVKLCLLTGSIVIIPNETIEKFHKLTNNQFTTHKFNNSQYSEIILQQSNRKLIVSIITSMFQEGDFNVIIGTKSLLGEGWDSPCINTLILASFIGSYVLSNQARGRAIRIDQNQPNKVANIYHLACLNPYNDSYSSDYENIKNRCLSFLGVGYNINRIEDGYDRLSLPKAPYSNLKILNYNSEVFAIAKKRQKTATKWDECIKNSNSADEVCNCLITDKKRLKHSYTFYNSILQFILALILEFFIFNVYYHIEFKLAGIIVLISATILNTLYLINLGFRIYRLSTRMNKLNYIGLALFNALKETSVVTSENSRVYVLKSSKNRYAIFLKNATTYEQNVFVNSLYQIFNDYDNPRYILARPKGIGRKEFYVVPDIFKKNKDTMMIYKRHMDFLFGSHEPIFTRSDFGKTILIFAQYNNFISNKNSLLLTKRILLPNDKDLKKISRTK